MEKKKSNLSFSLRLFWFIPSPVLVLSFTGWFLFCGLSFGWTQETLLLSEQKFYAHVLENHPLIKIAFLNEKRGEAVLLKARGGFDPKFTADVLGKQFDNKTYYEIRTGELKFPTRFGLSFQAGYSQNEGYYLDPERITPDRGLVFTGFSLSLGKGLLIDKERANFQKAKRERDILLQEKNLRVNQVLRDAGNAYWDWIESENLIQIYTEALNLSKARANAVTAAYNLGDKASLDTLEAGIQVRYWSQKKLEAEMKLQKSQQIMTLWWWGQKNIDNLAPSLNFLNPEIQDALLGARLTELVKNHAKILQLRSKQEKALVEKRYASEQLKPRLDVKYNLLGKYKNENVTFNGYRADYNYGIYFSMPLFLRKERGALKEAKLALEETDLLLEYEIMHIQNKVSLTYLAWENTYKQAVLTKEMADNYYSLLRAENLNFELGEGSVFLVNYRESKWVESRVKYLESLVKNKKTAIEMRYVLNILSE